MQAEGDDQRRAPQAGTMLGLRRHALFDYLFLGLFVVIVPAALASSPAIFSDGDVSWHLAAGRWIIANGHIPEVDPFSFTMGGRPWVAFEWLSEVIYASAFNAAGYSGLAALVMLTLMALHLLVFQHLRRRTGPLPLLLALVAMDLVLIPFLLARPHVLVWPLLAAWVALLLRAREKGRPPPLWTALAMTVWTNLHGSFPIGLVICAAIGLDSVIESKWKREVIEQWLKFAALSLGAAMLNANGIAGFTHPLTVAGMSTLGLIQEWRPSDLGATPRFFAVLVVAIGAILLKGARLRLGELALLLVMLGLAFYQVRHQSWLVIVAALILPPAFANSRQAPATLSRVHLLAAAALVMSVIVVRLALPIAPDESRANPHRLLAAVPNELRTEPVLNGYTFGGPLILAGIKPYIDGRSDMYGDDFFSDYQKIVNGDLHRFQRAVDRYGIRWTILPNTHKLLIQSLDESREWRRLYSDEVGVIHARLRFEPGRFQRSPAGHL